MTKHVKLSNSSNEFSKYFFACLVEPTCDTIKCEENEVCSPCGQNPCNSYDCDNLDGALVNCRGNCKKPACVCESKFHRLTTNGPCVPIICPK